MIAQIPGTGENYTFNVYSGTDVDVLLPSVAVYVHEENEVITYLAVEYIEIPKAHFKTFDPGFLEEITSTWIYQIFNRDYPIDEASRNLRIIVADLKRILPFKYEL